MNKHKSYKVSIFFGIIFSSVSPILSILFLNRIKVRLIYIPFIAACVSVIFVPFEDGLRYKKVYETINNLGYSPVWDLIMIVCKKLGVSFNMFKFLIMFIQFYWLTEIFKKIFTSKKHYYYALFLFIISIRFFSMFYGLRFNFAISLFLCGVFISFNKKYKTVIFILTVLVHYSLIPIIALYYLSLARKKINITIILFALVLLSINITLFINSSLFLSFITFIESYGANNLQTYFLGFWAEGFIESMSFKGSIMHYSKAFQFLPFLLISFRAIIFPKNNLSRFALYLLIFSFILFGFQTLFVRYTTILMYLLVFITLKSWSKINTSEYIALVFTSLFVFGLYFYDSIIHTSLDFTKFFFNI